MATTRGRTTRSSTIRNARVKRLKCRGEVERRLLAGEPVRQVAAWVQAVEGESLDVTPASLAVMLWRFLRDLRVEIQQGPTLAASRLDELDELRRSYFEQRDRLYAELDEDQRRERYTPSLIGDIEQLLRTLTRRHAVKMDLLGIHGDTCGRVFGDGTPPDAPAVTEAGRVEARRVLDAKMHDRIVATLEMLRERARRNARDDPSTPCPVT